MRNFIALCLSLFALPVLAQPVTVFAAASLRGALEEIALNYAPAVTFSFAGSGTLARQIAAGAPADVVILAHSDWADWLAARDLTIPESRREVAGGRLVLIGPKGAPPLTPTAEALIPALNGGRLAIGQRDSVPAGSYAREWLTTIGAWDAVTPLLAETDNVRAALALVAQGAAPMGVVYASDALAEPRVSILYEIPAETHSPIRYHAAAVTPHGRSFTIFLDDPTAIKTFAAHGFTP